MANETKLNLRLLRKVRNRIAKIPESYDQTTWVSDSDQAPCGTVACLAGEAIICSSVSVNAGIRRLRRLSETAPGTTRFDWDSKVPLVAAKELGLTEEEQAIFTSSPDSDWSGGGWPKPFGRQWRDAETPQERAQVAVAYLDECLKRKAVTW